jgi:mRNA-degrading endonuclease toxin of MazEF toxin-antitoxin module
MVSIAPITANLTKAGESGVAFQLNGRDFVILLDQITTVDKSRLENFIGVSSSPRLSKLRAP